MHALEKIWKRWFGKQPKNYDKIAEYHPWGIRCFGVMQFLQTLCTLAYGEQCDYGLEIARLLVSGDIYNDAIDYLDNREAIIVEGFDKATQRFYINLHGGTGWNLLVIKSDELPPMTAQKYNPDMREFVPIEDLEEIRKDASPA